MLQVWDHGHIVPRSHRDERNNALSRLRWNGWTRTDVSKLLSHTTRNVMANGEQNMNNAVKKLVDALRSGEYTQVKGMLHKQNDGMCCLGVACDISGLGKWEPEWDGDARNDEDGNESDRMVYTVPIADLRGRSADVLPLGVRQHYKWEDNDPTVNIKSRDGQEHTLAHYNDAGFTFAQIADIIAAGFIIETDDTGL